MQYEYTSEGSRHQATSLIRAYWRTSSSFPKANMYEVQGTGAHAIVLLVFFFFLLCGGVFFLPHAKKKILWYVSHQITKYDTYTPLSSVRLTICGKLTSLRDRLYLFFKASSSVSAQAKYARIFYLRVPTRTRKQFVIQVD